MFLRAAFMLRDQELQILHGSGVSPAFLPQDFTVLNYSAGTSEHDPPIAPVTAQPTLISHHIPPWDESKQAFSVTLPRTSFLTDKGEKALDRQWRAPLREKGKSRDQGGAPPAKSL